MRILEESETILYTGIINEEISTYFYLRLLWNFIVYV